MDAVKTFMLIEVSWLRLLVLNFLEQEGQEMQGYFATCPCQAAGLCSVLSLSRCQQTENRGVCGFLPMGGTGNSDCHPALVTVTRFQLSGYYVFGRSVKGPSSCPAPSAGAAAVAGSPALETWQ